jgi:hydroxyethylthiazole kinase-like uncharacterized protein yjeF
MSEIELNRATLKDRPLPAHSDGGKDDHGRLLIIAGSREVPGSALLCARAAFRSGAGKVRIATVESVAPAMALHMVEALIVPLAEDKDGGCARSCLDKVREEVERADAILAGPGMREGKVATKIATIVVQSAKPAVLDAGLLHGLPSIAEECRNSKGPLLLLPHSGELAALLDTSEDEVESDPVAAAHKAAERFGGFVLAKGAVSHIASPQGDSFVYRGGAPGLGVAGSGDALAGVAGALLARGADPLTALLWAVLLHGEAGEMLSAKIGPVGFLARELADEIPALLAR